MRQAYLLHTISLALGNVDMCVAYAADTIVYFRATLLVAPIAVPAIEKDSRAMVVAHADATNVSFGASSLMAPVVAPVVEGVDPDSVIPSAGAPAIRSSYERWREEEDMLFPGGLTRVLEAAIFHAADSLSPELKLCCSRSFRCRRVTDDLVAAFDAFAENQAEIICIVEGVPRLPPVCRIVVVASGIVSLLVKVFLLTCKWKRDD